MSLAMRKLQKVGNSTGVTIPAELLARAKMRRGSEVIVHAEVGRVTLTVVDDTFDALMAVANAVIADHPTALRKLAQ